ncbi:hypothetical protein H6G27_07410 [Nostoc linckia FACHB-104]|nr:hypothetical protein [Nostoc linckia FACHB-104]
MTSSFLSEMSAEPIHGGGITLHRILGHELDRLEWFIKVVQYRNEPDILWDSLDRCVLFPFGEQAKWLNKIIGCTLTYNFFSNNWVRKIHTEHLAKQLVDNGIISNDSRLLVCPQGEFTLYTIKRLRRLTNVPYITWFMDDHLVRWSNTGWSYRHDHEALMREHLQQAEQVFVISQELKNFYQQRFDVDSKVLFAPCENLAEPIYQVVGEGEKFRLAYFGSVGPWQKDALEALLPLVTNNIINLDIFTNNQSSVPALFQSSGVVLREPVLPNQVTQAMRNYDAIVLPISFRDDLRHMSCFNIATKMAECLGSGIPTLVIGPADSAMVKFLLPYDAAVLVTEPQEKNIKDAVMRLKILTERLRILTNAQRLVQENLSATAMQIKWENASRWLNLNHY